jgi:hypothetical protein
MDRPRLEPLSPRHLRVPAQTPLPSYDRTPEHLRDYAHDRSGDLIAAYATQALLDRPGTVARFSIKERVNPGMEPTTHTPPTLRIGVYTDGEGQDLRVTGEGGRLDTNGSSSLYGRGALGMADDHGRYRLNPLLVSAAIGFRLGKMLSDAPPGSRIFLESVDFPR